MEIWKRTHMCGVLRKEHIGQHVALNGWVAKARNQGGLVFVDLRDKTGITQILFDGECPSELLERAKDLRSEFVVGVKGIVQERQSKNPDMATGDIEILGKELMVYSEAETPPIYVKDDDNVDENLRLKYRYLDMRKPKMQRNFSFRHHITKIARDYYAEQGFTEVETPMLIKPTPEGARDYLVPSRVNPGKFYALPQSPQMFKQLLMVGGTDRYMQIVKCFRDEDLRADRQPEFTQIDIEMSFVDIDDVLEVQEGFIVRLMKEAMNVDIPQPLPRLSYDEAMERYGSDKPDTRFGFELKKLNDYFRHCGFGVFEQALESGGDIRGICITQGSSHFSRKDIDKLTDSIKHFKAKGMVWIRYEETGIASSVNKFFSEDQLREVITAFEASPGDLILIVADKPKIVFDALGFLRRDIAGKMGLLHDDQFHFLWVVDFPLFEENEEDGSLSAMHHPFTSPKLEDVPLLDVTPLKVRAKAYDMVLNGVELGGGSIRIHHRQLQKKMFDVLGIREEEAENKFGFLLEAFRYGTPPHGGIAFGLDRIAMLLAGEKSIREMIAFPKNQAAQCLVSEAPSSANESQLEELSIRLR
ncbi:MAG: aspartate--tRNA ligase [Dehalobacter sp. 4CP]|nr:aspartate--tRNA ligase [Dehalobacter sp. 4CP]